MHFGVKLEPGVYVVYCKMQFYIPDKKNRSKLKHYDINLSVYAEYACSIEAAPRNLVVMFTGNPQISWNPDNYRLEGAWNELSN